MYWTHSSHIIFICQELAMLNYTCKSNEKINVINTKMYFRKCIFFFFKQTFVQNSSWIGIT